MSGSKGDKMLQNWKFSSSGVPVEQIERLKTIACSFGATWKEFDSSVSVLLCTKVGSPKTRAAQELGIPLVHPDWLLSFDKLERPLDAFSDFRLKPLQGIFISVTGLSLETRRKVEQVCISLGAAYSGDLSKTCTHLIGIEPKGLKYEFALKCKMHIVTIEWLWSCQKYEKLCDESQYKLTTQTGVNKVNPVDSVSNAPQTKRPRQASVTQVDDSSMSCCITTSFILLSCRIYLFCCTEEEVKRGTHLLHLTGATRSTCLFSPLTHIVFGSDRHVSELHRYRELIVSHFHSNVRFVTFEWLNSCVKNGQLLYDGSFRVSLDDLYPMETFPCYGDGSLLPEQGNTATLANSKKDRTKTVQQQFSSCIFRGLRFRFHSSVFSMEGLEQELSNDIQQEQGVLVQDNGVPTHLIVRHGAVDTFPDKICIVTSYWVKACLRFHRLLSPCISVLFRPLQWRLPLETMLPCKITLSGFHNNLEEDCTKIDYNREYIKEIIHLIGACYLERLSRRQTTHLIVQAANSEKYQMALKWGIPVVQLEWLFACFQSGTRVPVDRYRFSEKTIVPSLSENMDVQSRSLSEGTIADNSYSMNETILHGKCREYTVVEDKQESMTHPLHLFCEASNVYGNGNVMHQKNIHIDQNEWVLRKRPYWSDEDKWDDAEGLSQVVVFEDKDCLPCVDDVKNTKPD
ncbi:DNA topoisomerase 2-binding protein 1 [Galdieria sulphuraria]|uniref:Topoisomerase (DNA) II binding protein 1 n=1 Tax=Galdieria sulphuraria TaxID=130081 RepID=M2W053_GALSU|nr:topoisomerase (DNA) II binding protein 1 [Galdieria sulphuraria]EME28991.1 topoisomerase (DNA) II binding protein 1 [Galdieria sulphuraria]GJD06929.1 DNA topoisomerase 2-binding protein 1 [Galdieria sulphuraria]|eukprot:XP_005705511.1 topoisomerase (DNA) II binding protein 1 [Galdieria sulphuraria]